MNRELQQLKNSGQLDNRLINAIDRELNDYENLKEDYRELQHDFEELSKENNVLKYLRDLCDRQQKVLDILKNSPFILERLAENDNGEFAKKYDYGTITDEEVKLVKKWLL